MTQVQPDQENRLWVISRVQEETYAPQVQIFYKQKSVILEAKAAAVKAIPSVS